jgi:protein-disulfide isomerase
VRFLRVSACVSGLLLCVGILRAQTSSNTGTSQPGGLQKSVESYLRHMYAFGSDVQVTVAPLKDSPIPGLLEADVAVKIGDNTENAVFWIGKDGKYLVRGEIADLSKDPLAENRAKMDLKDAPVMGDPKAIVTLVEYSDFECPVCRNLHSLLRDILPKYPQVKVVFKDFPLETLHPWARTAALAGRCAYTQNPASFWKMYDSIYDQQDLISASNAWTKMADFGSQAGLNGETFKSCMASSAAAAAVDASRANGVSLDVNSTPTIFVNGRKIVGVDQQTIEQFIQYELAQNKAAKK